VIVNIATQQRGGPGAARLDWVRQEARVTAQLSLAGLSSGLYWVDVRAALDEELAVLPYVEPWSLPRHTGLGAHAFSGQLSVSSPGSTCADTAASHQQGHLRASARTVDALAHWRGGVPG